MEIEIANEELPSGVQVRVRVKLSGREAGRLFLSGDTLIHLPLDGAQPDAAGAPIPRTSIYLSELASARDGITRSFDDQASADAFEASVRRQLTSVMEAS